MGSRVWILIICGGAILALAMGLRQSMGLYLTPITIDLGLGREVFALAMGLMNLVWGLAAPFAGAVADRYGAARVVVLGGVTYAAGLFWITLAGAGEQLIIGGVLIGFGLSGAGFAVVLGAVARGVSESRRSSALGLVTMGGSIGQLLVLPLAHFTTQATSWQMSLWILAGCMLIALPLSMGIAGRTEAVATTNTISVRSALDEAVHSRSFWLLNAGFFVCGFQLAFVGLHFPAWLADQGFASWLAPASLSLIGVTNIIGSWGCGWLGGYFPKKDLLSLLYLARAILFLGFILVPVSEASVLIFCTAIGFLWLGTVPLTSGVVAHIFGTSHIAMLFGLVFFGHQVGGFLGAWLSGVIFDNTGSYDAMWWSCVVLGVLAALLHWPIEERPLDDSQALTVS